MNLPIITAADGAGWEARLLAELSATPGRITVARRCVDVVELAAVAATGQARAALIDAQLRRLDAEVVERLLAAGVAPVGVSAPGAGDDGQRLLECGVRHSAPADAPVAVLVSVVEAAIADLAGIGAIPGRSAIADPAQASLIGQRPAPPAGSTPLASPRPGSVIAVWGPTGAPGRTMVATNLAAELAGLGKRTLLIDADVYGGVVASMFGLLDESPGLVAACRQAQRRRLDPAVLSSLCWQINPSLRVLTGMSRADRWPELRPAAVESVLEVSRELVEYTVLDLGFGLETDEELSYDTIAPRRNGATLAALAAADLVLVVGAADPIGVQRLVRGLDELRAVAVDAPSWVVLNRVRDGAVPGDTRSQLQDTLRRFAGRTAAALLTHDLPALDQAVVAGRMLAESAPNSPLRRDLAELACSIAGVQAPRRGRRRR